MENQIEKSKYKSNNSNMNRVDITFSQASTSSIVHSLKDKGKLRASAIIHRECSVNNGHSDSLELLLDDLLSPDKLIDDSDSIEWCKWLIAGGRTPSEFASIGE